MPPGEFVEIDFYQASGMTQQQLVTFLNSVEARDNVQDHPMYMSLQNDRAITWSTALCWTPSPQAANGDDDRE